MTRLPARNNLDWLRLLFASQVMISHLVLHMQLGIDRQWMLHFPGVPAFFFVSGLLVYASYDNSKRLTDYSLNRFLRLFPGLLLVASGALLLAFWVKGNTVSPGAYASWFLATITLGQAYNPGFLRDVGVGVMNGSLWSITVEILFYIGLPVLAWCQKRFGYAIALAFIASFALYATGPYWLDKPIAMGKTAYDFLGLTPLVWGWMFFAGSLAYRYFEQLSPYLRYGWIAAPLMLLMIWTDGAGPVFGNFGQRLGLIYFVLFAVLILYVAFELPALPLRVDLSYGVYIWHMVVINALLVLGWHQPWLAILITLVLAGISWFCIEKPALALKKRSLRKVGS